MTIVLERVELEALRSPHFETDNRRAKALMIRRQGKPCNSPDRSNKTLLPGGYRYKHLISYVTDQIPQPTITPNCPVWCDRPFSLNNRGRHPQSLLKIE